MVRKNIDDAATNLEGSISLIPDRYKASVAKASWKTAAASEQAESNYKDSVMKAVSNKSRQKGVNRSSDEEWRNKSINVGADRIGSGITANLDKYKKNFGPVLSAVNTVAAGLPQKTSDPMANIDKRLKPIVKKAIEASPRNK